MMKHGKSIRHHKNNMLTREQFQELRNKGLSVSQIQAFESGKKPSDLAREATVKKETAGNQFEQEKPTSFLGKARDFVAGITGGGKLAEGVGQSIAAPGIQKSLSVEQQETFDLQKKVLAALRKAREEGRDTSRLEKALKSSQDLATTLDDAQSDFTSYLVSNKEVIGSAVRLGGTLAVGGIAGKASKVFALGKTTTFASGAIRGAGVGATTGAIGGGIQGAGLGLEANKDAGGVATSAAIGAGLGAAIGAPVGAVAGGIGGVLRGRQIAREEFAKQLVAPKETPTVRADAIRQGRLEDPTLFGKAKIAASKRDEKLATAVKDVVSRDSSVGKNVDAIRYKIGNTNNGVKAYIEDNKIPFNTNQLRSQLETGKEDLRLKRNL